MTEKHYVYYLFDGEINKETTVGLFDFINSNPDRLLTIGLNSVGGDLGLSKFISIALNSRIAEIDLVAVNGIHSGAFKIFYEFLGAKFLTEGCYGMWHYGSTDVTMNENGRPATYQHEAYMRSCKQTLKARQEWAKSFMTSGEYMKFLKGCEVYFDFNRMKELFPDAEII